MTRIDLSGGDEHLREIAEESGVEWEIEVSEEETITIDGLTIEIHYNESAESPWLAWHAWARGYGSCYGPGRDEAIEKLIAFVKRQRENNSKNSVDPA